MMGRMVSPERADGGIVPGMATQPQAQAASPLAAAPEPAAPAWREVARPADVARPPLGAAAREPWDYVPASPFACDEHGYLIADSMSQNERHARRLRVCGTVLEGYFERRGGAVCGDLSMPYMEGQRHKVVVPDLFVALGEASGGRDSYKLWEESTPDFVLEDLSPSSERRDLVDKRILYRRLGVPEYWMFDETGARLRDETGAPLGELLVGYRLRGGEYMRVRANAAGRWPSEALGLELCVRDGLLRFFDPVAGEFLRTLDESERLLAAERREREAERRAKEAAQARIVELEAALRAQQDSA